MSLGSFYTETLLLATFCALVLWLGNLIPVFREHQLLAWGALALFTLLSWLMYLLGSISVKSSDKNAFIQLVLISVFLKMMLSFAVVVVYANKIQPDSKYFVLPFFFVYLAFTIFETVFLMRIAKRPPSA
jgi:hypothetical protein